MSYYKQTLAQKFIQGLRQGLKYGKDNGPTLLSIIIRAGCFAHVLHEHVFEISKTNGQSMAPTLEVENDWVFALKNYRLGRGIDVGDLIVAAKPSDPDHRVCKRITGMPGDLILVDPSTSSELTHSPRQCVSNDGFNKYIKVPEGHVWVTGDNLSLSLDSRTYRSVPMALIKGKLVAAMTWNNWIPTNFRRLENTFIDKKNI